MAGIDKTYVNKEQYIQAREFWIKTYKKQIRDLGDSLWLYPFTTIKYGDWDEELKDCPTLYEEITPEVLKENTKDINDIGNDSPLWNTSTLQDIWLYQNCKLDFVQERLKVQYSDNYFDKFKDINYKHKPQLLALKLKGKKLTYFYKSLDKENVLSIDSILVYGTTLIFKALDEVQRLITNRYDKPEIIDEIVIDWYGLTLKFKKDKWFHKKEEFYIPHMNQEDFKLPKVKYSWKFKDTEKYDLEQIFISTETEIYDLSIFKGVTKENIGNLGKYYLPDYLNNKIKY